MSDIFVKFSYGCKNIDFGIMTIKGWFLINLVNILWFTGFVVLFSPTPRFTSRPLKRRTYNIYAYEPRLFFRSLLGADKW
ncbi:hypothetical protein A4R26_04115 [Niastella populi]|uniref:Uncharacterized protein n=1 Tax=Niastella populi TaxID=550983 RepID=A0A1V9FJT9_9BACT|nr:hypothetical protein A4R26_04115 [Niastella populi]